MTLPHRTRGVKVLKAVSSPLRLQILNLLFDKGALSYTELMNALKMNPSRDAGRFAYHLKFLLKASLVEADVEAKKYFLTDLGKMVIDVADRVEKKAVKPKGMLVRTSHFTFEEFDANKITNSLIREAKVPPEMAQKAAKEAEKLILKSKTKYLTAPLIREIVNALLLEKGLEDYRNKLTRLGLPVHEVTALIEAKDRDHPEDTDSLLVKAGTAVFQEYTLLNVFPRDIADAHLSGALHISNLNNWVLKPNEVMHDIRFFFQNGLKLDNYNSLQHSEKPPESFQAALDMVFNVLLFASQEVNETQTVDYFNVFLAPYVKGVDVAKIKEDLRLFILNVNRHVVASLSLELAIPKALANKSAISSGEEKVGSYSNFAEESQLLAMIMLEILTEESTPKPLLNPKIIIKVNNEVLKDEKAQAIFLKAHRIASDTGTIYFASTINNEEKSTIFSASGIKLETDLSEDWETDTLRTGCLGYVTINLPRIVQESEKDKTKFFNLLKERCELAARALNIKYRALRQHGKTVLPFMMQNTNGDMYFRLENCSSIINFAGFKEAMESFTSTNLSQEENLKFSEEIVQTSLAFVRKMVRKHGKRVFLAIIHNSEASARLAQLDIEKYGVAKVKFSGTREKPYFSTTRRLILQTGNFLSIPSEQLNMERTLKGLNKGGNLSIIETNSEENKPEALMKLTMQLMEKQVEFLTYNHKVTYCNNCKKSWFGQLNKCPSCGAISSVMALDRFNMT